MRDLQEELRSPINTKFSETQSIDNSTGLMLKIKTWIQTWIRRVGHDYQFTQLYKCRIDIQRVHWMYSKPLMAEYMSIIVSVACKSVTILEGLLFCHFS